MGQIVDFCLNTILFQLHKHLFFNGGVVLVREIVKLGLVILLETVALVVAAHKFRFFLLDAAMVDFLVVALLSQLVISGPGFFCDDPGFIQLVLEHSQLVAKLVLTLIDWRDLRHQVFSELVVGPEFKPFSLEGLQRFLHAKLDEEIPQKFVCFGGRRCFRHVVLDKDLQLFLSCKQEHLIVIHILALRLAFVSLEGICGLRQLRDLLVFKIWVFLQ